MLGGGAAGPWVKPEDDEGRGSSARLGAQLGDGAGAGGDGGGEGGFEGLTAHFGGEETGEEGVAGAGRIHRGHRCRRRRPARGAHPRRGVRRGRLGAGAGALLLRRLAVPSSAYVSFAIDEENLVGQTLDFVCDILHEIVAGRTTTVWDLRGYLSHVAVSY